MVTTSKHDPNLDGMSISLAIDAHGSTRSKLHAIEVISLSDHGYAGRAWQRLLGKEYQPFHASCFVIFFRAQFGPSQNAQQLTVLTCNFEAAITALGVHEDIFEVVDVFEEMLAAFIPAIFVVSKKSIIHALCNFSNFFCRNLVINRNAAVHIAAM